MGKIKGVLFWAVIIGVCTFIAWVAHSLERLKELEKLTATQEVALQQKDAIIAAERANIATLKELAQHKEQFENTLVELISKTDKRLKEVLANDKKATDWWNGTIPDSVVRVQWVENSDTDSDSKTDATAR